MVIFDPVIEPILWCIVVGVYAIVAIYFIFKYRGMGSEARPFIRGVIIFILFFMIGTIMETMGRYFNLGYGYEVFHLFYFIVPYIGNSFFYFVFEKYILKKGINKNTRYILTIFSILEGIFLSLLVYPPESIKIFILIGAFIGFFVIAVVPIVLFIYLSITALIKEQKIAWLVIMVGFVIFVLGVAGALPEASAITKDFSPIFIYYIAPIMQAMGTILMGVGFTVIYRNIK